MAETRLQEPRLRRDLRCATGIHLRAAVDEIGGVLVVGVAEQAHHVGGMCPGAGEAVDVVEFEKAGLRTAVAALVDERAPAAVAFVNHSPDRGGDVAGFGRFRRSGRARTAA